MGRNSGQRVWAVFVLALALCALITVVRHESQKSGETDLLTSLSRRFLFSPVLHGSNAVGLWWHNDIASLFRGPSLAAQNRHLRTEVANLMAQNRTLADQATENTLLRALLNFKTHDSRNLLPAEVLALKPFSERDSAIFSDGSDSKVKIKEPALDDNGNLVGQVTSVTYDTSDVMLLTDTLSSVGARVVPPTTPKSTAPAAPDATTDSSSTVGICVGNRSNLLELTDLSQNAQVAVGDTVVTSGLGGVYPKDIPIGKVVEVDLDNTGFLKTALIMPDADFNHLQEGFILR
jgi:rod shape-determining protein MreC